MTTFLVSFAKNKQHKYLVVQYETDTTISDKHSED